MTYMQSLPGKNSEINFMLDWQPMEGDQFWCNVKPMTKFRQKPCGGVLHQMELGSDVAVNMKLGKPLSPVGNHQKACSCK